MVRSKVGVIHGNVFILGSGVEFLHEINLMMVALSAGGALLLGLLVSLLLDLLQRHVKRVFILVLREIQTGRLQEVRGSRPSIHLVFLRFFDIILYLYNPELYSLLKYLSQSKLHILASQIPDSVNHIGKFGISLIEKVVQITVLLMVHALILEMHLIKMWQIPLVVKLELSYVRRADQELLIQLSCLDKDLLDHGFVVSGIILVIF